MDLKTTTRRALSSAEKHSEQRDPDWICSCPCPAHWLKLGKPFGSCMVVMWPGFFGSSMKNTRGNISMKQELKSLTERLFVALLLENVSNLNKAKVWRHSNYKIKKGVEWDTGDIKHQQVPPTALLFQSQTHQRWGESTALSLSPHFSLDYFILLWIYLLSTWQPGYRRGLQEKCKKYNEEK